MISLFEKIILTDTSFIMRDDALMFLGWVDAQSSIPFLLEYYKKQGLSEREKVRIGTTLAVLESWDNATKVLDENCYDLDKDICSLCETAYYKVWNKSSLKYYKYIFNNKEFGERRDAALRIAEIGDMQTVHNYLKKDLNSSRSGRVVTMRKLSKIGDKKSMKLVENVFKNQKEDIKIREEAWSLLNKNKNKNSKQK
jgi:hypothetical protein